MQIPYSDYAKTASEQLGLPALNKQAHDVLALWYEEASQMYNVTMPLPTSAVPGSDRYISELVGGGYLMELRDEMNGQLEGHVFTREGLAYLSDVFANTQGDVALPETWYTRRLQEIQDNISRLPLLLRHYHLDTLRELGTVTVFTVENREYRLTAFEQDGLVEATSNRADINAPVMPYYQWEEMQYEVLVRRGLLKMRDPDGYMLTGDAIYLAVLLAKRPGFNVAEAIGGAWSPRPHMMAKSLSTFIAEVGLENVATLQPDALWASAQAYRNVQALYHAGCRMAVSSVEGSAFEMLHRAEELEAWAMTLNHLQQRSDVKGALSDLKDALNRLPVTVRATLAQEVVAHLNQ